MGWLLVGIIGVVICFVLYLTLVVKLGWECREGILYACLALPLAIAALISLNGNANNYNEKKLSPRNL